MAERRHPFLAHFVLKLREKINWRKKKQLDLTRNFQQMVRAPAFSGREKIGNSYYFKILGIV